MKMSTHLENEGFLSNTNSGNLTVVQNKVDDTLRGDTTGGKNLGIKFFL